LHSLADDNSRIVSDVAQSTTVDGTSSEGSKRNPANFSSGRAMASMEGSAGSLRRIRWRWDGDRRRDGSRGGRNRRWRTADGTWYDDELMVAK
jgi:hypothetical protein